MFESNWKYVTTMFFWQEVLVEDVWHANVFMKLGDVQVAFGIFSWCFTYKPFFYFIISPLF